VTGCTLNDRNSIPGRGRNFSLHHRVQTGSGAHPAGLSSGYWGSYPWDKAVSVWRPFISIKCRGEECMELHLHSSIRLLGVVLSRAESERELHVYSETTNFKKQRQSLSLNEWRERGTVTKEKKQRKMWGRSETHFMSGGGRASYS
jgi:hypothetical protein